jgi:hypothetical protein
LLLHFVSHLSLNNLQSNMIVACFLEVKFLSKDKFDKGDLKKELKRSGFDDCIADNVADRVNDKKTDEWDANKGREQALLEAKMLLDNNNRAYDNFRQK